MNTITPIIENPNTSGQGFCSAALTHPAMQVVQSFGYTYSHTTAMSTLSGSKAFYHTCKHGEHNVTFRTLTDGTADGYFQTSTSCASGRKWSGWGLPELRAHLTSKKRRYNLKA
jgi:hypothetical protein